MQLLRRSFLFGSPPSDELVVAQFRAFMKRVPILYAVLTINTVAVAITHVGSAPLLLSVVAPVFLIGALLFRLWRWLRLRGREFTAAESRSLLNRATRLAITLSLTMLAWGMLLYPYDDATLVNNVNGHGHVVLYVGLTVICCATLLMHLRYVAALITLAVVPPFCFFLVLQGRPIEIAVAVNLSFVAAAMLHVLIAFSRDFQQLVLSKIALGRSTGSRPSSPTQTR